MKKSIFLFFAAILCSMSINAAVPSKLYLDASGWGYADARYAAYFMPQNSFVDMTKAPGEVSVFEVAVPASQTKVIFVRMNGSKPANDWANKWNQTGDLVIPTDGKNKFKPSGWDNATTTWSTYTYTPPTLYIAGDFVTPNWDPAAAANKMDYADGVYSKSYNDVAASAHQFKITNGGWDGAIGYNQNTCSGTNCKVENKGGNIQFTPLAEGTVTITYTLADGKVHITCPEPPAAEFNITYPATQTNYTLVAGPAKAQTGAEVSFTATPAEGYVLNVTYNGNVIAGENNIYTFMMPAADVTIAITAVAATTLYYVDHNNWGNVNAYMWNASGNNGWPGVTMTAAGTVGENNYAYYSVSFAPGAYTSVIFSNNGNNQTADQTINTAKPYFYDGAWYTWDELLAKLAAPVVTYDYYIAGTENLTGYNWKENGLGMIQDGELYKATFTELNAGTYEFKITAGDWKHQWNYNNLGAAYEEVSQGTDGEGNPNGNIKFVTEEAKNITVIFDPATDKITFEGLTLYVVPLTYTVTVPAGTEKCYIAGAFAQSNWNTFVEMTKVGDEDKFTIEIVGAKETDEYKYACQADWAYAEVIDGGGNRTNWSELDEVTAWGKPVIVTYQLKGVGGWDQPGIELVQNPDPEKASEYMLTCQAISATDAIKVVRLEDGVIKDYYGNGTVKDGVEVTVNYDGDGNITLPEGKYNFYFDTNESEKKLWIAAATDCPATVTIEDPIGSMSTYTGVEENDGVWSKVYNIGDEVTIGVDQLGDGWLFAYWTVGGEKIFTEEYTFTVTEDVTITANYGMAMDVEFDNMELDQEFWVVTAGPEAGFGIELTLGIDVEGEHPKGYGLVDGSSISLGGDELELVTGYFTTIDPDAPSAEAVVFAVYEEMLMAFVCTMTAAPAPALNIVVENATLTNETGTSGFLYMNSTWSDGTETYPVQAEIPGFTINAASATYAVTLTVGGQGDDDPWLGSAEGEVSVTVNNGLVTVAGLLENAWTGFKADVTISGTLTKDYTRTVTAGNFGTICLPFGGEIEGAELYELVKAEADGVLLGSVEILEAGVPYIFKATATELVVYSDGTTAATAGNHNGLYGTFTDDTEVAQGNYIVYNNALCKAETTCYVDANRAYVVWGEIPTTHTPMPGRRYIGMSTKGENETTGVEDLFTTEAPAKVIENGQFIIIREGVKYNVQGQKL